MPLPTSGLRLLLLGLTWPCIIAGLGLVALATFQPSWSAFDSFAFVPFLLALLGIPAIFQGGYLSLPERWPEAVRIFITVVAGVLATGCSLYGALLLFVFGSLRLGYFE
jgi:hypothetical protein